MISFKTFITEQLLCEAYDYSQIFSKVRELAVDKEWTNKIYTKYHDYSVEILKKNFRIIWYNKLLQLYMAYNISKENETNQAYFDKLANSECKQF